MLDQKFKNLYLLSAFNGHDQSITIVEQYDIMSLYIKCS